MLDMSEHEDGVSMDSTTIPKNLLSDMILKNRSAGLYVVFNTSTKKFRTFYTKKWNGMPLKVGVPTCKHVVV